MSSFLSNGNEKEKPLNHSNIISHPLEGEEDLFPNTSGFNSNDSIGKIDNDEELNIELQKPFFANQAKSGSSSRRYRKQSKNKFKGKEIDTNLQLQRNDPFLNTQKILSNK